MVRLKTMTLYFYFCWKINLFYFGEKIHNNSCNALDEAWVKDGMHSEQKKKTVNG